MGGCKKWLQKAIGKIQLNIQDGIYFDSYLFAYFAFIEYEIFDNPKEAVGLHNSVEGRILL
jgi:hypothetical protein